MNAFSSQQQREVLILLDALREQTITREDHHQLRQLVANNEQVRDMYCEYMLLTATMRWTHSTPTPEAIAAGVGQIEFSAQLDQTPIAGFLRRTTTALNRPVVWSILAVAVVFYGTFAIFSSNLRPDKLPMEHSGTEGTVAMVRSTADVQWSLETKPKQDDWSVRQGESLKIDSGIVQLELNRGAMLAIEGPAQWSIEGDNSATLHSGKLIAKISRRAIGFTLNTPTIQIVDLGTEFGVDAGSAGQTQVEVFAGKVDVNDVAATADTAQPPRRIVRMSAGQAKQFSKRAGAAAVTVIDVRAGMKNPLAKQPSTVAQEEPQQVRADRYAAAILADHPLAYWRLTDGDTGVAIDSSGNGHNGAYKGAMRSGHRGMWPNSSDRCVRFLGPDSPGWLEMKDVEIPASFTTELWARASTPKWNSFGWLISSPGPAGFLVSPDAGNRGWGFHLLIDGKIAIVGTIVGYHIPQTIDDRFHHYATAFDAEANQGWLCFDGVEVLKAENVLGKRRRQATAKNTLWIGTYLTDNLANSGDGWVDEVAIYGRALSAEEIHRHFDAAGVIETKSTPTSRATDGGQ